jgi:hypothetical protein
MQKKPIRKTLRPKTESVAINTRILEDRVKVTGANTRMKGHQSATARRQQSKRDSKN